MQSTATSEAPTLTFEQALAVFQAGEGETLLPALEATFSKGPADPRLWNIHGLILRQLDRRDEAIQALRKAAEMAPGSAAIAHALARTLFEAGLPSLEAYGRALRLAPDDTEILAGLTSACAAEGEADAAIDGLEKLLVRSPQWVDGHALIAKLRWAQGEREGFARSFEQACSKLPRNIDLWREWIIALQHAEQWDEILRVISAGRAAIGDNLLFSVNEAIVFAETGDFERAEKLFEPHAAIADATVQIRRVRHYLRWGRPADADSIIEQWSRGPEAFMFWPYASVAWRMLGDKRWEWLEGDERFVGVYDLAEKLPPLDRLADCLRKLHRLNGQPLNQSLRGGTQTEGDIFMQVDPLLVQLREAVRSAVADHAAQLPDRLEGHPLLAPPRHPIRFSGSWSVRLKTGGFHANHVHPMGWLSSALYIVLPTDVGQGEAGFLTLGDPRAPAFDIDMEPFRTVEPKPGRLVLFPSYMWHGTRPFGEGERLTVAFDVAVPTGS